MTNREWVNGLDNEKYAKFLRTVKEDMCCVCAESSYYNADDDCGFCNDGIEEWLEMEHNDNGWEERDYRYCV